MPFQKGHIGYGKGKQMSEEHKRKIGLANKGKKRSEESKQKMRIPNTKEQNRKNSEAHKGNHGIKEKNALNSLAKTITFMEKINHAKNTGIGKEGLATYPTRQNLTRH